ncbi:MULTISPECIES: carbonic anhydrase [Vibrio]|uniref:carbonic anhydrase n=1 Tax=Vibrio TaxID=662 RepID=UPI0003A97FD7|nr:MULTISPECIES: carbonic anhydrase family protein [Vibrio]KIP76534.1 carbonic anhydrase [Vibrio harveyi]UQA53047.1 carbonic anhydrase family protein [Vibrio sp. ED002]
MKKSLLAIGLLLSSAAHAEHWGYEGENGPEFWGKFSEDCQQGKNQSPVNIQSTVLGIMDEIHINYLGHAVSAIDNGHTLQASVEGNNTLLVDDKKYTLSQFHFHTPSENHINGEEYPLEAHFVHADKDGNLAVVAVFYKLGDENPTLEKLLNHDFKKGKTTSFEPVSIKSLVPSKHSYYRFNGSLTTPPCSEGVRWLVLKEVQTVSAAQVKAFMDIMGKNNRPIQPINARLIIN